MSLKINLTGERFGRWVVLEMVQERHRGQLCWRCRCDCGTEEMLPGFILRSGKSKSCGCLRREMGVARGGASRRHGEGMNGKETPEYRAWTNMLSRCRNPNHKMYPDYGGRGISVCKRWELAYENFLTDVGRRPTEFHSIDRINNDGNYEPGNVRWATYQEQNRNQRRRGEGSKARLKSVQHPSP